MRLALALLLLLALAACRSSGGASAPSDDARERQAAPAAGTGGVLLGADDSWSAAVVQSPAPTPTGADITFEGNRSYGPNRLTEVISGDLADLERRSSKKAVVDDAAYSLELYYRSEGFPGCRVTYDVIDAGETFLRAVLRVDEGPRVEVGGVRFHGVSAFGVSDKRVREGLEWQRCKELERFFKPKRRRLFSTSTVYFVEEDMLSALRATEAYYKTLGYLDVQARLASPELPASQWSASCDLWIDVTEGLRYVLRGVTVRGGLNDVDRDLERRSFIGLPLSPRTAKTLRERLRELYLRAGYPDATVDSAPARVASDGSVQLELDVQPGTRVTVADVRLRGLKRTSEPRVHAALELGTGDLYDVQKVRDSFRNLYRLGVFSGVSLDLVGEGPQRDLEVSLEEAPSRELYIEPGYGSYEGPRIGLGWNERNVFGSARALDLDTTLSKLAQRATISLSDGRFLDTQTGARLSFYADRREEPSFLATKLGSSIGLSRSLGRQVEISGGYEFRFSILEASDINDPLVQKALQDVNISSISLRPSWDTRDSAFFPREGMLARLNVEYGDGAIGSQLDFLRARWNLATFEPLSEIGVLGVSWRGGVIAPIHTSDTIPIQERFFNGGENTVRSFSEDKLGPVDVDGSPIGGEAFNVFTAELRQEIAGRFEGAIFYDTGNLLSDYTDFWSFEDFRSAIGVGLRYNLPVGPLRVDAGWNPDPQGEEADYAVHFSVGFSF